MKKLFPMLFLTLLGPLYGEDTSTPSLVQRLSDVVNIVKISNIDLKRTPESLDYLEEFLKLEADVLRIRPSFSEFLKMAKTEEDGIILVRAYEVMTEDLYIKFVKKLLDGYAARKVPKRVAMYAVSPTGKKLGIMNKSQFKTLRIRAQHSFGTENWRVTGPTL